MQTDQQGSLISQRGQNHEHTSVNRQSYLKRMWDSHWTIAQSDECTASTRGKKSHGLGNNSLYIFSAICTPTMDWGIYFFSFIPLGGWGCFHIGVKKLDFLFMTLLLPMYFLLFILCSSLSLPFLWCIVWVIMIINQVFSVFSCISIFWKCSDMKIAFFTQPLLSFSPVLAVHSPDWVIDQSVTLYADRWQIKRKL